MCAPSKFSSSSAALVAGISALALMSSSADSLAQQAGQSAFNRGIAYQAQLLGGGVPQFRTHLVGEVVTRPMIVQAPVGTTVVAGSTAINVRTIVAGPGMTAAQLDVRCPLGAGRVVMFGNRVYNAGQIVGGGDSAQVVTHCDRAFIGSVMSSNNELVNTGRIQAIQ